MYKRRLRIQPGIYDVFGGEELEYEYRFEGVAYPLLKQEPVVTRESGAWVAWSYGWEIDENPEYFTLKYQQPFHTAPGNRGILGVVPDLRCREAQGTDRRVGRAPVTGIRPLEHVERIRSARAMESA